MIESAANEMKENETETNETKEAERERLKTKHAKLIRAYEHYRELGEIYDPAIAALMDKISELEIDSGQNAVSRLSYIMWRQIVSDAVSRIEGICSYRGIIREIDATLALDILDDEIRKLKETLRRGCGYASMFERLILTAIAIIKQAQEMVKSGERNVENLRTVIEI